VQALVRNSKCSDIFANEKEAQASIQQWLEYIVICIDYADVPANVKRILNVSIIYIVLFTYICIKYVFLTENTITIYLLIIGTEYSIERCIIYNWYEEDYRGHCVVLRFTFHNGNNASL